MCSELVVCEHERGAVVLIAGVDIAALGDKSDHDLFIAGDCGHVYRCVRILMFVGVDVASAGDGGGQVCITPGRCGDGPQFGAVGQCSQPRRLDEMMSPVARSVNETGRLQRMPVIAEELGSGRVVGVPSWRRESPKCNHCDGAKNARYAHRTMAASCRAL